MELDVFAPLTFATQSALADLNIALPASMYISATGGLQPYTYTLAAGSIMPPGLNFNPSGGVAYIQGTPTTSGHYSFTVHVTDSFTPPMQATQTFSLNVINGLVVTNTALPDAVQNLQYREQIKVAGGTPPYHFVLGQFSSTPPGLTLDSNTGIVSGTPTTPTTDTMLVLITDSAPTPVTINPFITLNVAPPLSFFTTSLQDGIRTLLYGANLQAVGGRGPYTLSLDSGTLPDGISIFNGPPSQYSYGLSGTAQKDGTFQFTLRISDSYETPNTVTKSFQIRISDPISISGPGSVGILYNQSYSTTFPVTGGIPPYTWAMSSSPPSGFTFDTSTGTFSGTATGPAFLSPNVSVQDSSNPSQRATYFQFVFDVYGKLTILPTSLPPVASGSNVMLGMQSTGGAAPLQWSASGSLPPGMNFGTIGDLGSISGSPTTSGSYTFTINLSDGNAGSLHQTASQQVTLVVKNPGQMHRNDTIATAVPLSNILLLASISPFFDPQTITPDSDYYSASAIPGSIIQVYVSPNNDFLQPPEPNSLQPVLEVLDATGKRYQTCGFAQSGPLQAYNLPCVNNLAGSDVPGSNLITGNYYAFQVPGTGTAPITFYIRISDARGDARPDFIYTFSIFGVN